MLKIRKAQFEDCLQVFELRNHKEIRKNSLNEASFSFESHEAWFKNTLQKKDVFLYVILDELSTTKCVVRYNLDENLSSALVSIFVDPESWGAGIGTFAISQSEALLKKEIPTLRIINAQVKVGNEASMKLFERNGFQATVIEYRKKFL